MPTADYEEVRKCEACFQPAAPGKARCPDCLWYDAVEADMVALGLTEAEAVMLHEPPPGWRERTAETLGPLFGNVFGPEALN